MYWGSTEEMGRDSAIRVIRYDLLNLPDASVSSYRVHVTVVTCQRSQVHNETTTIRTGLQPSHFMSINIIVTFQIIITVNPIGTPIITSIFRTSPTLANFDITLTSVQNGPHVFEISYYTTSVSPVSTTSY